VSNDKPKQPEPQRTGPERLPVRVLQFFQPHPSFNATTSLTSTPEVTNRNAFIIEYVPSMRHHRVEYRPIDGKPLVRFVHESHVASWEPMA